MDLAYAGLQKVQEFAEPFLIDWLQKHAVEHDASTIDPNTNQDIKDGTQKPVRKRINVYEEMRRQEEEYLYGESEGTCFAGTYNRSGDDEVSRAHDIEEGVGKDVAGEWPSSRPGYPFAFSSSDSLNPDNVQRGNRVRERDRVRHGKRDKRRKENSKFAMDSSEAIPESGRKWGDRKDEEDNKMMDDITWDMFRPTMEPLMPADDDVPSDDEKYMDAEDYQNQKLLGRLDEYNRRSYKEQRSEEKDRSFWEKQENMRKYKDERLDEKERRFWKKREQETEKRLRREAYPIAKEHRSMSTKQEAEPDKRNPKARHHLQDLPREHHHQGDHSHNQQLVVYRPQPNHRAQQHQPPNPNPSFWERRTVYTFDSSPSASSIPSSSSSSANDVDWRRAEKRRKPEIPKPARPVTAGYSLMFDSTHFASIIDNGRSAIKKEELKETKREVTIPERETLRRPNNLPTLDTNFSGRQERQEQEEQKKIRGEATSSQWKLKGTGGDIMTFQETCRRRNEFPTLKSNFPEGHQRRQEQEEQRETRGVTCSEKDEFKDIGSEATISKEKLKALKGEGKIFEKEAPKRPTFLPTLKTNFPGRQRRQRREEQEEQMEPKEQKLRYQKPKSLEFVLEIGHSIPSRPNNQAK